MLDSDRSTCDDIMEGAAAHLLDPSSLFSVSANQSCSTYSNGRYALGSDTADYAVTEGVRRQIERCDLLCGVDVSGGWIGYGLAVLDEVLRGVS